jgi:WD40 repeat protein
VWRKGGFSINGLAISPDDRWIVGGIEAHDSATGALLLHCFAAPSIGKGGKVSFSADGRRFATAGAGYVSLWETDSWRLLATHAIELGDAVSLAPDGKQLVTGVLSGKLELWQAEPLRALGLLGQHQARIRLVAYSPDGQQVASIGDDNKLKLWDVGARKLAQEIGTRTAPALALAFTPDGRRIVTGEHDNSVRVYTRRRTLWGKQLD